MSVFIQREAGLPDIEIAIVGDSILIKTRGFTILTLDEEDASHLQNVIAGILSGMKDRKDARRKRAGTRPDTGR
jgi:hypothetical protein